MSVVDYFPFHRGGTFGQRIAVTVHDLRAWDPAFGDRASQRNVAANIEAAGVVFTSWKNPHDQLLSLFPQARDKIVRVPFPVMNAGSDTQMTIPRGHNPEGRYFLYPASFVAHKNHRLIIEYVAEFRPFGIRFVFTGNDRTEFAGQLKREIEKRGIAAWFEFRGFVRESELADLMRGAWGLLMPSLYEAASGPVMEAMVNAVPVLCADLQVFRDQMIECGGDAIWFDGTSPRSLAEAIARLDRERDQYVAASARGGSWYSALNWQETGRVYASIMYEKLVAIDD